MIWFQHALRICAIASVFITAHGYVLFAANIEDFKSLAKKFVSEDLAEKLINLISQSTTLNKGGRKQQYIETTTTRQVDTEQTINKVADTLKTKLFEKHKIAFQDAKGTTVINNNKRYMTVNPNSEKDDPEIKYDLLRTAKNLRDNLENSLQKNVDYYYNKIKDNLEIKVDQKRNKINLEATTYPGTTFEEFSQIIAHKGKGGSDDTHKKLDYTETKLGEWNYDPKISQAPVTIKYVKTGYSYNDIGRYNEINTFENYEKIGNNVLPGKSENKNKNQHAYESNTFNKYVLGKKPDIRRPKYQMQTIEENYKYEKFGPSIEESNEQKFNHQQVEKHDSSKKYVQESRQDIYKRKPEKQPMQGNDMYKKHLLSSKTVNNNERKDQHTYAKEHETFNKHVRELKQDVHKTKQPTEENDMYKTENSYKRKTKHVHAKKDDTSNKYVRHKHNIQKNKPVEENNMYEKHLLSSKTEYSKERKDKRPQAEKYEMTTKSHRGLRQGVYKRKPHMQPVEENYMPEKYLLSSKTEDNNEERINHHQVKEHYIKNKHDLELEHNENTKTKPLKQPAAKSDIEGKPDKQPIEENYKYEKHLINSKSNESNERKGNSGPDKKFDTDDKYFSGPKQTTKRGHQKRPIEENDMYEKHLLGSNGKDSNEGKINHQEGTELVKTPIRKLKNKFNQESVHDKDDQSSNEHLVFPNKKGYQQLRKSQKSKDNLSNDRPITVTDPTRVPLEGFADDPLPDFKEVKAESIKSRTESLLKFDDDIGKPTKRFTMKGTDIPPRQFYKLSSPDYYKKLPRIVEKYNFDEPLPDKDRERDIEYNVKREPARANRKVKLLYE